MGCGNRFIYLLLCALFLLVVEGPRTAVSLNNQNAAGSSPAKWGAKITSWFSMIYPSGGGDDSSGALSSTSTSDNKTTLKPSLVSSSSATAAVVKGSTSSNATTLQLQSTVPTTTGDDVVFLNTPSKADPTIKSTTANNYSSTVIQTTYPVINNVTNPSDCKNSHDSTSCNIKASTSTTAKTITVGLATVELQQITNTNTNPYTTVSTTSKVISSSPSTVTGIIDYSSTFSTTEDPVLRNKEKHPSDRYEGGRDVTPSPTQETLPAPNAARNQGNNSKNKEARVEDQETTGVPKELAHMDPTSIDQRPTTTTVLSPTLRSNQSTSSNVRGGSSRAKPDGTGGKQRSSSAKNKTTSSPTRSQSGRKNHRLSPTSKPAVDRKKSSGNDSSVANSKNESSSSSTQRPISHQNDPPWNFGPSVDPDNRPPLRNNNNSHKKRPETSSKQPEESTVVEPPVPFAEPGPEWKKAKMQWGPAWEAHIYVTGPLFAVLAFYSFISLLRLRMFTHLLSRGYFMSLNFMMLLVGLSRSVYILYDAYNSNKAYPPVLAYFLFNSAYPCLSSAFAILFLALLQATRVRFLSPKVQRPSLLGAVVVFHFCFSITTDIVVGSLVGAGLLLFICQVMYLLWSFFLCIGYFYVFQKLYKAALRKQSEMIRVTFTKLHIDGADLPKKLPRPTLSLAVKVTLLTAIFGLLMTVLQIYGMVCVYGMFVIHRPDPWPWWGYQLASRLLELAMCTTMSYIATQPMRHYDNDSAGMCSLLFWFPCSIFFGCCKKENADYETYSNQYTSQYGFRNENFNTSLDLSRPWDQEPALPTFQNPAATDMDDPVPLNSISKTSTQVLNNPSTLSLLSSKHSKGNASNSTNEGLNTTLKTLGTHGTLSSVSECRSTSSRQPSMLYNDKGFIRFRKAGDPEQVIDGSDDETSDDSTSMDECDSLKANMGSSAHTLCDDDIVQSSLSPFFHGCYHPQFKRMSRCSLDTTDNSVDLSSDQMSNVTSRNGLSSSVLDFQSRKYGSTCSSESAANSFDVAFYLGGGGPRHCCHHPHDDSRLRVNGGRTISARSVSPIANRAPRRTYDPQLRLNLINPTTILNPNVVNVSCGTEDITPDSAVYLDLHLSPLDRNGNGKMSSFAQQDTMSSSIRNRSSMSHSLNDLNRSSNSGSSTRSRRTSKGFLNKLKGSTFSLNASLNGYEPLESDECTTYFCGASLGKETKRRIKRSVSDTNRPRSALESRMAEKRTLISELCHGDSGMLDATEPVVRVDEAIQTDPVLLGSHTASADFIKRSPNRAVQ